MTASTVYSYLGLFDTVDEGIAGEAGRAGADGIVVHHLAVRVRAARAGARVHALLAHAGLAEGAV